jgi:hypothetical protein
MPVPGYQEFMLPLLTVAPDGKEPEKTDRNCLPVPEKLPGAKCIRMKIKAAEPR